MPAIPQPCNTITLDDLAAIATSIQPLLRSADTTTDQTTRRIEAIFARYGVAFTDATDATDQEASCR